MQQTSIVAETFNFFEELFDTLNKSGTIFKDRATHT